MAYQRLKIEFNFNKNTYNMTYDWTVWAKIKTDDVEISSIGFGLEEAAQLLASITHRVGGTLLSMNGRRYGPYVIKSGKDKWWDWCVEQGFVLPDDRRIRYTAMIRKPDRVLRIYYFNSELGPFAVSMILSHVAKRIRKY